MSLGPKRTCPVCHTKFAPVVEWQVCDTYNCSVALRMRRYRARKRGGGDDGGGGRQRRLFPKPLLAKPPKAAPVAEPTLFETDVQATLAGAVEHMQDGSLRPIRTGIMSTRRKPSRGALLSEAKDAA